MSKVYGIFFTKNGNILLGYGGSVGGVARRGGHLPGGTANGKKKAQEITTYMIRKTLLNELDEEFGASARDLLEQEIDLHNPKSWNKVLDGHRVYLVFCEIDVKTAASCCGDVRDSTARFGGRDDPYDEVRAVHLSDAHSREVEQSWFLAAIEALDILYFNGETIENKRNL